MTSALIYLTLIIFLNRKDRGIIARSPGEVFKLPLILLLLLTSTIPVYSQSPPVATRETVIEEIKNYADRHVKSDSPMQTQLVVDLYRDNSVGLTLNEIAQIYEEHYTKLKSASKSNPWDELFPKVGWIAAIILVVLLIFRDALKEWASKFIKAVGSRIYGRLSGNRFFYLLSLKHYRKALVKKYEELHIPFRPNRPLLMREVYVPLRAAGSTTDKQVDAYRAVADYHRLMIKGPPGSGKSMLLKHLALSYAEGRLDYLEDQPIPILLELHRLNDSDLELEHYLTDELTRNAFPHAESFVKRALEQGVLMLLFDGLDEVNSSQRARTVQRIKDFLDKYRACRFVCTCRTAIYHDEFSGMVDQTLEVVEFKDQQIRRFLRSWEPSMPEGKSIEQLMQTLSDRPRIMALARNPLLLTIIAYLYTDTNFVLPQSRAEFYERSTDFLLEQWHQERNQFKAREKRLVLQQLALSIQDSAVQGGQDRRTMEFQLVINHVRRVLPELGLQPEDTVSLLDEIVERSGLLLAIDGGTRYSFAHLTVQEFFAASRLRDNAEEMIARFRADHDSWRETIKLWCGLAIDSTGLIQVVYTEDPITAFECLADAQKVEQALASKIVEEFKSQLGLVKNETSIVQAFGAVASDSRPRGLAVFEFLEETLKTESTHRRLAAASALSYTNLPRAAKALAERCMGKSELLTALIRMGDVAVPTLVSHAQQSKSPEALDGLYAIATPQAARAMAALLWHSDETLATQAAWRLAAMLVQPDIEDSLRDYPLTAEQRRSGPFDWVWQPFAEPENSTLPTITGRIAYLLEQGEPPAVPMMLDSRLAIPLCATKAEKEFVFSKLWEWDRDEISEEVDRVLNSLNLTADTLEDKAPADREESIKKTLDELSSLSAEDQVVLLTDDILDATIDDTKRCRYFLNCLKPDKRYDLLRRLIKGPAPSRNDWINIFTPVKYDLRKGWHFRVILALFALLTIVSLVKLAQTAGSLPKPSWLVFALMIAGAIEMIIYWVLLELISKPS